MPEICHAFTLLNESSEALIAAHLHIMGRAILLFGISPIGEMPDS
jgi:hypothetical protein